MDEEESTVSEEEITLITISAMIDTILEQVAWLKVLVDEELEKFAESTQ